MLLPHVSGSRIRTTSLPASPENAENYEGVAKYGLLIEESAVEIKSDDDKAQTACRKRSRASFFIDDQDRKHSKSNTHHQQSVEANELVGECVPGMSRSSSTTTREASPQRRKPKSFSLLQFFASEICRGYDLEHAETRYSEKRKKVYAFIKIPRELEQFLFYGFLQCLDAFLYVFTFLPLRAFLAVLYLLAFPYRRVPLNHSQICDIVKVAIILFASGIMSMVDTSVLYHMVRGQAVIKLYIFFNMLEVADKLFSSFGQDIMDALFWTATEPMTRARRHIGLVPHTILAVFYVVLHTLLVLFQATTLNVAFNSQNKALLTIMLSNNFVELKSSVFKKFAKNNLFQMSCSDVRERFHYCMLLLVVVVRNMVIMVSLGLRTATLGNQKILPSVISESGILTDILLILKNCDVSQQLSMQIRLVITTSRILPQSNLFIFVVGCSWKLENFLEMLPDLVLVFFGEFLVDWVKHAFITKFNGIPYEVYKDFKITIAYDVYNSRRSGAFSDHSDQVSRRMGFIPLPLTVLLLKIIPQSLNLYTVPALFLVGLFYVFLTTLKLLNSIVMLGKAQVYIAAYEEMQANAEALKRLQKDRKTKSLPGSPRLSLVEFGDVFEQHFPSTKGITFSEVLQHLSDTGTVPNSARKNGGGTSLLQRSQSVATFRRVKKSAESTPGEEDSPVSPQSRSPSQDSQESSNVSGPAKGKTGTAVPAAFESLASVDRFTLCNDDRIVP